jgi:perosamine synthetase
MKTFIPQMQPVITDADIAAVDRYMRSGAWLTEFDRTRDFAEAIRNYSGARFCTVVPSGTMALFLALAACGVGVGDEVVVPSLTMAASASAVLLAGARVVFGDIEPDTLCLDLNRAPDLFTDRTKAVIFVSLNGRAPGLLSEFVSTCQSRGIAVIEDAAQSLGSHLGDRHLGTIGACGCFSFSSQKIVTTGQGGAVITNDEALYQKMLLLRDFGRESGGTDRYNHVGWNLKFTDLQAVVGVEQMRRLPQLVSRKRSIFDRYRMHLSQIPNITVPGTNLAHMTPWFMDALVEPTMKAPLEDFLRERRIGTRRFYPPLHSEPAYLTSDDLPVATEISARGLWLPSSVALENDDVDRVCEAIDTFMRQAA